MPLAISGLKWEAGRLKPKTATGPPVALKTRDANPITPAIDSSREKLMPVYIVSASAALILVSDVLEY